jgi:hypothetical protein
VSTQKKPKLPKSTLDRLTKTSRERKRRNEEALKLPFCNLLRGHYFRYDGSLMQVYSVIGMHGLFVQHSRAPDSIRMGSPMALRALVSYRVSNYSGPVTVDLIQLSDHILDAFLEQARRDTEDLRHRPF